MPIRINLLAENQALEDLRRRDPIKRAAWVGGFLVTVLVIWSISLFCKGMVIRAELSKVESQLASRSKNYQIVLDNQRGLAEVTRKLGALTQLATNRLLYGSLLNSFQRATLDDVQLMRLRADQSYQYNEEIKTKTNAEDRVIPGKPASVTERIQLTLEARDSGPNPGDQVNRYKQALLTPLGVRTNDFKLAALSPPQMADNKAFVLFTLECRYPEKTR